MISDKYYKNIFNKTILKDIEQLKMSYRCKFLDKCLTIFKYTNLPETIPQRELDLQLFTEGFNTFTKVGNNFYVFKSSLGGEPNPYYLPTLSIVSNPALNFTKSLKIDEDCIVIKNDSMYSGILDLIDKYSVLLSECDISFHFATINSRSPVLIYADNDKTKKDGENFFKQLEAGTNIGIIGGTPFFEGIKTYPVANGDNAIQNLTQLNQYLKSQFYMELGLPLTYNMKREALSQNELTQDNKILLPFINDMLECRKQGIDKVNKMYNLDITVELNKPWSNIQEENDLDLDLLKSEISDNDKEDNESIEEEDNDNK